MSVWVVVAYRYGTKENVFAIGAFSSREIAEDAARQHRTYRGGKYSHRICEFTLDRWDDDVGQGAAIGPFFEDKEVDR